MVDQQQRERYSRWARRASSVLGRRVDLRVERYLLKRSWADMPAKRLQGYLVGGYQNPTINVQSILARHTIVREIDGPKHDALMEEELRWAVEKHRQLRKRQQELTAEHGTPWSELKRSKIWRSAYKQTLGDDTVFATRWSEALREEPGRRLSVIEAACGSANDYRFFDAYGIAPLLAYTGFDLTEQNIANARRMFPGADFQLGDVQDIQAEDASYDWAIAHDLLEHLSPTAFNRAIDELCRVSRRGVLISFFSMTDAPEHEIQVQRTYHRNRLSRQRTEERFAAHCSQVEWLHIRSMLKERYDFNSYYNAGAWTMIARH